MDAAESVLQDAIHGIPPAHLFAYAKVYHVDYIAPAPAADAATAPVVDYIATYTFRWVPLACARWVRSTCACR